MQSFSPHIIKHYIPFDFSKQAVDLAQIPTRNIQAPIENPFTNKKLAEINCETKCFTITFNNKSNKLFQPKKKLTAFKLFQQFEDETQKMKMMKQKILECNSDMKKKDKKKKIYEEEKSISREISSRKATQLYRTAASREGRVFSSANLRSRIFVDRVKINCHLKTYLSKQDFAHSSNNNINTNTLRITGSKAPESQIIDHLKRNSSAQVTNHLFYKLSK